jgi:hypothetical protein
MHLDDDRLLMGFFMNRRDANDEYVAGVAVELSDESFNQCCDGMYSHLVQEVGKNDRWTFFMSVIYSVVKSIEENYPAIIKAMEPADRPIFKNKI